MKTKILDCALSLADLLQLISSDKDACIAPGENPKLAFNAVAEFSENITAFNPENLKKFCDQHRAKGNLTIGFLSYETGVKLHKIKPKCKSSFPAIKVYSFENYIENFGQNKIKIFYKDSNFLEYIKEIISRKNRPYKQINLQSSFKAAWNIDRYALAFEKVQNYIKKGDVYQLNLTYPLYAKTYSNGKTIFSQLNNHNHAAMAGYLESSDFEIISMSPEKFIRIKDGNIETFPIKGTRAKVYSKILQITEELLANEKEKAELSMITDLLRNDLGIVCEPGSIKIKSQRSTTELSRVIHTYSHIIGRKNKKYSSIEALLKMLPGGSITGCPKKRSIEIINDIEDYARGPYTGILFSLDSNDNLESSILIRSVVKRGESLELAVGGGIVFDSKLEDEYQETIDKSLSITEVFNLKR